MIDLLFDIANLILALSMSSSLYLRLKYRRFGNIPKWWEKFGWTLMLLVIIAVLGDFARNSTFGVTLANLKLTKVFIALYFGWYALTMYLVTRNKKKVLKPRLKLNETISKTSQRKRKTL